MLRNEAPIHAYARAPTFLVHVSFSAQCKKRMLFTREQQAQAFFDAYTEQRVFTTTLRSVGNFKEALRVGTRVRSIPGITKPRSFELLSREPNQVTVGMKQYVHSPAYTGMDSDGNFEGSPIPLFISGIPLVEEAPAFMLKTVDAAMIDKIKQRYDASHSRVDAAFPHGECISVILQCSISFLALA